MKLSTTFFTLSLALGAISTPLGDRAVFRRHAGVPAANARRYILQSRMDAPPACVAKTPSISNSTDLPDLSNSTITDPTATDVPTNTTATDDSSVDGTDTTGDATDTSIADPTANSTDTSGTDTTGDASADNSTVTDTSNSTDTSTRRRRRGVVVSQPSHVIASSSHSVTLSVVDLAFEWQSLCLISGGGIFLDHSPCLELAGVHGFNALLADAGPCAQQEFADSIITWAKSADVVNRDDLIAFAIKYRRHPRTAVSILGVVPSTLYCTTAPVNPELTGITNAQPDGVNPGLFGSPNAPMVPFGSDGTCPLGTTADVSTCSCIPDSTDVTGTDNSTIIDPSATASANDSAVTDATATVSADDSTVTDATATASADASAVTASADASAVTDSTAASDATEPTATDSAVSDAAAPTDSASATDDGSVTADSTGSDATDSAAAPAATPDASGLGPISGDVNDPNGRRRK